MRRDRFLYIYVFVVGSASLGTEIAAARLIAPFFGASTIVWANTIGVVLVALSIGYWWGGRLADRNPQLRGMCLLTLGAAALLTIVPLVSRPFFGVSVKALDSIEAGAFIGSLFAVLLLIAIPVVLLGAVTPYAIRLSVDDLEHSGRTAGRLYAVSTAGSLAGTWLSALLLIPLVGTQRTFITFAIAVAIVAAAGMRGRWILAPILLALALAIPVGTVKAAENGRVIAEVETDLQYARVIERGDGSRILELNEGQAIHSLYKPGSYLTGRYWDGLLVAPFSALDQAPSSVAILGNAAGTAARSYGHFFPDARIDGVEIDGALTDLGRRYFDLGGPNLTIHTDDARPWLRRSDDRYDVIAVDAYRQPYIPFYLATTEFFDLVADHLNPGGVVIVNVGHPGENDDLETTLGRTLNQSFATVLRDPIEEANTLLIGTDAPASAEHLFALRNQLPSELRNQAVIEAARIEPRLPGGRIYTDDLAPVEWLIDKSILGYAGDN